MLETHEEVCMIRFISSQSHNQFIEHGRFMIESFQKAFPNQTLNLYTEDFIKVKITNKYQDVNIIDLKSTGDIEYQKFQEDKTILNPNRTKRFAHKAFAVMDMMKQHNDGLLVWIDCDVLFKKPVPLRWIEVLVGDNLSAHLGLIWKGIYGAETGFFILNLAHPLKDKFLEEYRQSYVNRDFEGLRKSFDNDIYGRTIKRVQAPYNELSTNLDLVSPFNRSCLKEYMYHYKAHHKERMLNTGAEVVAKQQI